MVLNRARIRQVTGVTSKTPSSPHQNLLVCCLLAGLPLPIQELQHSGGAYTTRSCGIGCRIAPTGRRLTPTAGPLDGLVRPLESGATGRVVPTSQHLRARTAVPRWRRRRRWLPGLGLSASPLLLSSPI